MDAVICVKCGRQVEELKAANPQPHIVITNDNSSKNANLSAAVNMGGHHMGYRTPKSKITALLLCFFLGVLVVHKFYEGSRNGYLYLLLADYVVGYNGFYCTTLSHLYIMYN